MKNLSKSLICANQLTTRLFKMRDFLFFKKPLCEVEDKLKLQLEDTKFSLLENLLALALNILGTVLGRS